MTSERSARYESFVAPLKNAAPTAVAVAFVAPTSAISAPRSVAPNGSLVALQSPHVNRR